MLQGDADGGEAVPHQCWTIDELRGELRRFEKELVAAGKAPNTVQTYVGRSDVFVRWLAGEYRPREQS